MTTAAPTTSVLFQKYWAKLESTQAMRNFSQCSVCGQAKWAALISDVVRRDIAPSQTKGMAEYSVYNTMMAIRPPWRSRREADSLTEWMTRMLSIPVVRDGETAG